MHLLYFLVAQKLADLGKFLTFPPQNMVRTVPYVRIHSTDPVSPLMIMIETFAKGFINLALMDSDKWDKTAHATSYIVDSSPKCTEYHFPKDDCSSFLIKCCLKNS